MSTTEQASYSIVIIGTGRAGQARIRAAESLCTVSVTRAFSIRKRELDTAWAYVEAQNVDLVIICAENALHAPLIDQALQRKQNVLVEFPLVNYPRQADRLWKLAERQHRHLLCECIALLTPAHQHRKDIVSDTEWQQLNVSFQGGIYRWIEDEIRDGHIGQLSIGRLQAIWDLVGPVRLESVRYSSVEGGYRLEVVLRTEKDQRVYLKDTRRNGATRQADWRLDGVCFPSGTLSPPEPLFVTDLSRAIDHIRGEAPYYLTTEDCRAVLTLAEEISHHCRLQ